MQAALLVLAEGAGEALSSPSRELWAVPGWRGSPECLADARGFLRAVLSTQAAEMGLKPRARAALHLSPGPWHCWLV